MIWRFKSNKVRVGPGIRAIDHRADGSIWLAVGDRWSETELAPEATSTSPTKNTPPVAGSDTQSVTVEPHK